MKPIPRSRLIWVTIPANTTEGAVIQFPDVPELRNKRVIGMESYHEVMLYKTPDLVLTVAVADFSKFTVTLKDGSLERQYNVPCETLNPQNTAGLWKMFTPFVVNWQSSYVRCVSTLAVATAFTVPFLVFYEEE